MGVSCFIGFGSALKFFETFFENRGLIKQAGNKIAECEHERRTAMKKMMVLLMIMVFSVFLSASSAIAGDKQHHRWEGVAIGVGAAVLGHALLNSCNDRYSSCAREPVYYRSCPPRHRHGYWETRSVWVEPDCRKVWNPGHYDCYGRWVSGRWQMIETSPGYWEEERVWVSRR